jgi:8-oxo-dGTP pyrophosphatase MutT (NUDIX family)|tara:strand:- start:3929 stop:4390 length:462 start_codon:yes stop_codon:yes gene_type:complete
MKSIVIKMNPKYRQAVFIVTYAVKEKEINYLILKRKAHWRGWEFPKGGINFNELKIDAVKREVLEETGEKALRTKRFNFHGKYKYKRRFPERKDFIGQEYSLYSAEIKYGGIKIDKMEHSSYVWLPFDEALKKVTFKNQKKSLEIVNKWLKRK